MAGLIDFTQKPGEWDQGIYELESYEKYDSIQALRSSDLKKMMKSPAHYRASKLYIRETSPQQERSFARGKAFDTLTLHGREAFEQLVTIELEANRNTKIYKEWRAEHADAVCILTAQEKQEIIDMHTAAMDKRRFSEIFGGDGIAHRVIVWQCRRSGLWCKAEIDWIKSDGTVVDLKSTADAGFWFFGRNAARLGYMNQGAYYLDGLEHVTGIRHQNFQLAAVEVDAPWESHVFRVSSDQLIRAQCQNEDNMWKLKTCFETDEWPGYPDEIMDLESGQYFYDDEFEEMGDANGF